jgi:hypothetical protein
MTTNDAYKLQISSALHWPVTIYHHFFRAYLRIYHEK